MYCASSSSSKPPRAGLLLLPLSLLLLLQPLLLVVLLLLLLLSLLLVGRHKINARRCYHGYVQQLCLPHGLNTPFTLKGGCTHKGIQEDLKHG